MGAYLGSNSIDGGGFNTIIIRTIEKDEAFLQGSLTSYYNPSISQLGPYVFMGQSISNINCPNVVSIGSFAFSGCSKIKNLSFPNCTLIGNSAFYDCRNLTTVYLPNYGSSYVPALFGNCHNLSSVTLNFSAIISLRATFSYCDALSEVSKFSYTTTLDWYTFYNCTGLRTVNFPAVTSLSGPVFGNCYSLVNVSMPNLLMINGSAFFACYSLSELSFPNLSAISGTYAFSGCYNLISLNLTGVSSVPILANTNAFISTPIGGYSASAGQYGSIYVPASLYDSFIVASNWSYFSSRIVSV
jgi:hypothetical protein